jgi:2-phosphosulfolactate phosphatase
MDIYCKSLIEGAKEARGLAVVIDVIRAFSTAAYAFNAGAGEIILVGTVEEAFALRERFPDALLMGEVDGIPIAGFDYGNSPAEFVEADLGGRPVIQRTSSGTQGVVNAQGATQVVLGSFVVASATVAYIWARQPEAVSLLAMGTQGREHAAEDESCAAYLAALLRGEKPDAHSALLEVWNSRTARRFFGPAFPGFDPADIGCVTALDLFDFAMAVERRDGLYVARKVQVR